MGDCCFRLGRLADAETYFKAAICITPEDGSIWLRLATLKKDVRHECSLFLGKAHELLRSNRAVLPAIYELAVQQGCWKVAAECCRDLVAWEPQNDALYEQWSNASLENGDHEQAITAYEKVIELRGATAEGWHKLASIALKAHELERVRTALDRALECDPGYADACALYSRYYLLKREDAKALEMCERALAADPGNPGAIYQLTEMEQLADGDPRCEEALARYDRPGVAPLDRMMIAYSLGRVSDKARDFGRAAEFFAEANRLQREGNRAKGLVYDRGEVEKKFGDIRRRYSAAVLGSEIAGTDPGFAPIFIVGMPRSGTTLTDKIISNHPRVHSCGENQELARIQTDLQFVLDSVSRPDLAALLGQRSADYTQRYQASLPQPYDPATRYSDKAPLNFLHVGLISLLFPGAKIVHTRRNPLDTCLSMYMRNFRDVFLCSNDLADLAHYYRQYLGLMAYWEEVLPGRFLSVDYENLVADQEGVSRAMIAHCGLDWDPHCLTFYDNSNPAFTFSEVQVRKPIYSSSIGKWRDYKQMLAPLRRELEGG